MKIRPLKLEVQRYLLLRQRLIEAFPRIDNETLHDTLEGITTLEDLIAETIRSALLDEAFRAGLSQRLDDIGRSSRLEQRAAKKRQWALEAMSEAGLKKLEQADFTASVRRGVPSLDRRGRERDPTRILDPAATETRPSSRAPGFETGDGDSRRLLEQCKTQSQCEDKVMGFTDTQTRQLRAKLDGKYIKRRNANGTVLHYLEGWHVIAEANRIFGFDGWDRHTLRTRCVWTGMNGKRYASAYTARVRVRFRAGDVTIVREGCGTGEGDASTPGEAHEIALKSAETDATKRALTTFGNRFGLALYDRDQNGVRKPRSSDAASRQARGRCVQAPAPRRQPSISRVTLQLRCVKR